MLKKVNDLMGGGNFHAKAREVQRRKEIKRHRFTDLRRSFCVNL